MKIIICLLIIAMMFPVIMFSQYSISNPAYHKLKSDVSKFPGTSEISMHLKQKDSIYYSDMMLQLDRAIRRANTGLGFSVATNLSLLINVRMYNGDFDDASKGIVGLVGMATGTTRLILSFATIKQIKLTEETLALSGYTSWNDHQLENSKKHLKIAKNATIAIPVLSIVGFGLIAGGLVGIGNDNTAGYVAWSLGWGCAIGGLTSSIIASSQLAKVKKILVSENGSLNLGIGNNGVGLCYSLKSQ